MKKRRHKNYKTEMNKEKNLMMKVWNLIDQWTKELKDWQGQTSELKDWQG